MIILEDSESNFFEPEKILIKKSTFNLIVIGIVVASIASAFLGGYMLGSQSESSEIIINEIDNNQSNLQKSISNSQQSGSKIIRNISLDDDPLKGNPDAPITIVEFSDFQCPFCWRFYTQTLPLIEQNYMSTGKVNFVYRDFPITSIHPNAVSAALAGECADDQGKFWEMHNMIFENQKTWQDLEILQSINLFKQYANEIGLNTDEFDLCVDSGKYLDEINNDLTDGRNYGVTGTPGFFVGNEKIGFTKLIGAQPFSSFQSMIDSQLSQIK